MLIEPSANWRGTSGMIFTEVSAFRRYLDTLKLNWKPIGIVLHNTAAPNYAQWEGTVKNDDILADANARLRGLTSYYRDEQHWNGGPHLFITKKLIIEFNPLTTRGTHTPSWNATHFGIEMVGDFSKEPFYPEVRDLAVGVIAALNTTFGFDPEGLKLHKEDPRTDHDCPGKNVNKGEVISRVIALMNGTDFDKEHKVETPPRPPAELETVEAIKMLQTALNLLGASPKLVVDGWRGKKTKTALLTEAGKP